MTKHTAVLAGLSRRLSRSGFGKAVKEERRTDKGVRTLPAFDFFKQMVYGRLSGCFHTLADKAQITAGKTKKLFKNPLRIIGASVISLRLAAHDWASYGMAKGVVKLHLGLDRGSRMTYDAYLTTREAHDIHGVAEPCGEGGVIYVLVYGYV